MEHSNKSWVESGSLTWTLFVLSLSLTTGWVVFVLTLWGIPDFTQFLYAGGLGLTAGFAVFACLYAARLAYLKFGLEAEQSPVKENIRSSDGSNRAEVSDVADSSSVAEGSSDSTDGFLKDGEAAPKERYLASDGSFSANGALLTEGTPPANDSQSIEDQPLKSNSALRDTASDQSKFDKTAADVRFGGELRESKRYSSERNVSTGALGLKNQNVLTMGGHNLQPLKNTAQAVAALREFSLSESMAISVSQATVEPSHLTLGAPHIWSPGLIKALEWRVFDRLSVAYWAEQGNRILGIKKDFYRRNKFFVCAATNKKNRIAVVQSHSAHSAPISKVEMQYLIKIKEVSNAKVAILMHSGNLSNVVRSFCINNNIRLLNESNICKGLLALPMALQDQMLEQLIKTDYMVPTCPNCRTKMKHRRHKRTGKQVWGCRSYPACRIMMDYYTV